MATLTRGILLFGNMREARASLTTMCNFGLRVATNQVTVIMIIAVLTTATQTAAMTTITQTTRHSSAIEIRTQTK